MKAKFPLAIGIIISQIFISSLLIKVSAITANLRGTLPSIASEASGLDFSGVTDFWTHNDGGTNKIYRVSNTGSLKQSLTISDATNTDWEDITHNSDRTFMYIGDFGNNYFDRRNLKIYRIPYPTSSTSSVTASAINFTYPDQKKFPSSWKNFDVEAFFHENGKLFLFTKGDGSAIGYTKLYSVPDNPGTYTATLIDSFYVNTRITGAAISPDSKSVILISNTKIFLFRNFSGTNIFHGACSRISISGSWTQKEGVSFYSNNIIYLVDEGSPGSNHIYMIDLSAYIITPRLASSVEVSTPSNTKFDISVFPNPANSFVNIQPNESLTTAEIEIINLSGQVVDHRTIENPEEKIRIETDEFKPGAYVLLIVGENIKRSSLRFTVIH